jgi:hypothetical protein
VDQLRYSSTALAKRMALALIVVPVLIFVLRDETLATGHVRGFWGTLLYEIGPAGRAVVLAGLVAILGYLVVRCAILFADDRLALRATAEGMVVRSGFSSRKLDWAHIRAVAVETRTVRGRSFNWIVVWSFGSGAERKLRVVTNLLETGSGDINRFLETAQALLRDSRQSSPARRDAPVAMSFGRREPDGEAAPIPEEAGDRR